MTIPLNLMDETEKSIEKKPQTQEEQILSAALRLVKIGQKDNKSLVKAKETIADLKNKLKEAKSAKTKKTQAVSSEIVKMATKITEKVANPDFEGAKPEDVKKIAGRITGLDSDKITRADIVKLASVCMEAAMGMPKPEKTEKQEETPEITA